MLTTIDALKPGDRFIDLDPDPRLDVEFTVVGHAIDGKIVAIDQFGYEFHFRPTKIVRIRRF